MACIVKLPTLHSKGIVSFTTYEDIVIANNRSYRDLYDSIRSRFVTLVHYNHFSHQTHLEFDLHLAGEGDLHESNVGKVRQILLTACSFAGPFFHPSNENSEKHWDILFISRAVDYKGIPHFIDAIRKIYNRGNFLRVLMLCPVESESLARSIKSALDAEFSIAEQSTFNLLLLRENYPFFFDRETLAFFFRAARVFVQASSVELRGRVAGYAWSTGIPVIGFKNIAIGLPTALRKDPAFWEVKEPADFEGQILKAWEFTKKTNASLDREVVDHFSVRRSNDILINGLKSFYADHDLKWEGETNLNDFDIRIARHNGTGVHSNSVNLSLDTFLHRLKDLRWLEKDFASLKDPESALLKPEDSKSAKMNVVPREKLSTKIARLKSKWIMSLRLLWR